MGFKTKRHLQVTSFTCFLFKQYKKYIVYAKKLLAAHKKEEEIIPERTLDQSSSKYVFSSQAV